MAIYFDSAVLFIGSSLIDYLAGLKVVMRGKCED